MEEKLPRPVNTDFERLLFCEDYIRQLKILALKDHERIKELESEIAALREASKLSEAEKIKLERGDIYENLVKSLRDARQQNHNLQKMLKLLRDKIIQSKIQDGKV
jgi:hypothetical protein